MSSAATSSARPPAVEMIEITRRCPQVLANDRISLRVEAGSVHALVGENGAGKSTLMKILGGLYEPDSGQIRVDGQAVRFRSPADAIAAGIGMVHQHFMLIPPLTVTENVILGDEGAAVRRGGVLDLRAAAGRVRELAGRFRLAVDPEVRVEQLGVGEQQRVEILKVLFRNARIIILDEPTAVLTPQEVDEFFETVRGLRDSGATIILISHKLHEVMALSDRLTILRGGRKVADLVTAETSPEEIARLMVGREVALPVLARELGAAEADARSGKQAPPGPAAPVLHLQKITVHKRHGRPALDSVSLEIRPGEILGIAGVEGNGQSELVEALTGLRPLASGRILIAGRDVTRRGPRGRFAAGLACIPEDRHRQGLILDFSLRENLLLGRHHRRAERRALSVRGARALLERFDVRPPDPSAPASRLSGGNQQKVVVARETTRGAAVLVAAQPTRGVDLGAIESIRRTLLDLRARGTAILLVSAELSEILGLSDRVAVLYAGRIVFEAQNRGLTEHDLGVYMTGGTPAGATLPKAADGHEAFTGEGR